MKRLFLFASYSPSGRLGDATLHYVKELSALGEVVFRSDSDLDATDIGKMRNHSISAEAERHGEYDFGSYKRAWIWVCDNRDPGSYNYVYLLNDSVIGPLSDLEPYLKRMESSSSPFFGMVLHPSRKTPHIQSWFVGTGRRLFLRNEFDAFLRSVRHEEDKKLIYIKYENGLTDLATRTLGFKPFTLFRMRGKDIYNRVGRNCRNGLPFIKKSSFTRHNLSLAAQICKVMDKLPENLQTAIRREITDENGEGFWERFHTTDRIVCLKRFFVYLRRKF